MRIRAFLFDFDGLILDTELASRAGWELLYREHGHALPADLWATLVGTTHAPFDPMTHLEELVGEPLPREALNERRYAHEIALIEAEELRPGIAEYSVVGCVGSMANGVSVGKISRMKYWRRISRSCWSNSEICRTWTPASRSFGMTSCFQHA